MFKNNLLKFKLFISNNKIQFIYIFQKFYEILKIGEILKINKNKIIKILQ